MRTLAHRFGPHLGLVVTRVAAVILFCIAGAVVAGFYFPDMPFAGILGMGVAIGVGLGLAADEAAVAYGKRLGRAEIQDHQARQAAARDRAGQQDNARRNAVPIGPPFTIVSAGGAGGVAGVNGGRGGDGQGLGGGRGGNGGSTLIDRRLLVPGADGGPTEIERLAAHGVAAVTTEEQLAGGGGEAKPEPDRYAAMVEIVNDAGVDGIMAGGIMARMAERGIAWAHRQELYPALQRAVQAGDIGQPQPRGRYYSREVMARRVELRDTLVAAVSAAAAESGHGPLEQLRDLVNDTLQPEDLLGQQGRGVIQLAAELGRMVPSLDAETVTAYIGDHVLIAAGLGADQPERWPAGLLDGVRRLRTPQGRPPLDGVTLERVDGLDRALPAAGEELPLMLDTIVRVVAYSGRADGLNFAQIGVALGAKGYRVGPYTLAAALARLVKLGRLDRAFGEAGYQLSERELEQLDAQQAADVTEADRPPLDVVVSVLNSGPLGGMTTGEVAAELHRRRDEWVSRAATYVALTALADAGRVRREPNRRVLWQLAEPNAAQVLAGPGLRHHVLDVVTEAEAQQGIGFDDLLAAVQARPGFAGATAEDVHLVVRALVSAGRLRQDSDVAGSYRLPAA